MRERKKAEELLAKHGITVPVDVEKIAEAEGLEIVEWKLNGVDEAWLWPVIGVDKRLSHPERRWAIAHALGHYVLHRGNHLWFREHDDVQWRKQERQAETFAAWLLIPQSELSRLPPMSEWEIAEHFEVPPEMVALRFST